MCKYVTKKELKEPKKILNDWIIRVQKAIKKEYKITFSFNLIGSGKRNLVIKSCNTNWFDLDCQLVIQKTPKEFNLKSNAKKVKEIFRKAFDREKPDGFSNCEDSTQALTSKNKKGQYSYDIIITYYETNELFILRNDKNSNDANNKDYKWAQKGDMKEFYENYKKIFGSDMWNHLRNLYINKRHSYKDNIDFTRKKSYQILNESVNETLKHFRKLQNRA